MVARITADQIDKWRQTGFDLVGDPNEREHAYSLHDITDAAQRSRLTTEDAVIALHEATHVVACCTTGIRLVQASRKPKGRHMGSTVHEPLSRDLRHVLERQHAGENVLLTPSQKAEVEAHLVAILAPIELIRAIYADHKTAAVGSDQVWKQLPQLIAGERLCEKAWEGLPEGFRSDLQRATGLASEAFKEQMPELCEWAIQRGKDVTLANWVHVEVTIGALLELETIDGETIRQIIDAVHPPLFVGRLIAPTSYCPGWRQDIQT